MSKKTLYDIAQERLIACILRDSSELDSILEIVDTDDIESPQYSSIFNCIVALARNDQPVTPFTVAERLLDRGELDKVDGIVGIQKLSSEGKRYLIDAPIELYARVVKEASAKSKLRTAIKDVAPKFEENSGVRSVDVVSELQNQLNESLLKLSDTSTVSDFTKQFENYLDLLDERRKTAEENEAEAEGLQGIPSLLPSLNLWTTGWVPGQLIAVAAGTAIGKSVFAVNCILSAAKAGKSVLFFSLEMSKNEIEDRLHSSATGIPLYNLKNGRLDDDQKNTLKRSMESMKDLKIVVDEEARQTVDSIRARALKQAQSPSGLDFVVVDYVQLITPTGRFSNRQEAVSELSRNMKLLAKQLGVPVMVLAQLKRKDKEEEKNSFPTLEEIRESGSIASDSDVVILLHRDRALDGAIPHTFVILAKNRNGPSHKTIRCHSNLECSLFREVKHVKEIENMTEGDELSFETEGDFEIDASFLDDDLNLNLDDDLDMESPL